MTEPNDNEKLPAYAWPGGYPIIYLTADGDVLCAACASADRASVRGHSIHWEGAAEQCVECHAEIESAYGDPDADEVQDPAPTGGDDHA